MPGVLRLRPQLRDQRVGGLVLARERRLVRIDVLLHERAHLGAPLLHLRLEHEVGHQRESARVGARKPGPERDLPRRRRRVAGLARGLGGGAPARRSSRGRSTTSPAEPARRRRSGRTARRSSGGACGRGCSPGNAERDLSVEVLGLRSPAPFLLGPVGVLSIVHPEAELGVARASKATGVPMMLSSAASTLARGRRRRARRRAALVPALLVGRPRARRQPRRPRRGGRLRRDRRHARHADARLARPRPAERLPALPAGRGAGAVLQRPALPRAAGRAARGGPADGVADGARRVPEPRPHLGRPRVAARADRRCRSSSRACCTAEDARLALEHGVDGIVVSNHGGRQVDGAVASLDALVEVRDAVGGGRDGADGRRHPPRRGRAQGAGARRRRRPARPASTPTGSRSAARPASRP